MANSLGRDIHPGEIVVLSGLGYVGLSEQRRFVCESGSGMVLRHRRTMIYGAWEDGSGRGYVDASLIDKSATERCQQQERDSEEGAMQL